MDKQDVQLGQRVRVREEIDEIPAGTEGIIDEDFGVGCMVAWDLPDHPLPLNYKLWHEADRIYQLERSAFEYETELDYLEVVKPDERRPIDQH